LDRLPGEVVEVGAALEPAERGVVLADDAGVRGGALSEVDPSVAHDGPVRVVVAEARQVGREDGQRTVGFGAQDAPALEDAALRDVEGTIGEVDSVPGAVAATFGEHDRLSFAQAHESRRAPHLAVAVARFDDAGPILRVEAHARRHVEAARHERNAVALGNGDVSRAVSRTLRIAAVDLGASARRPQRVATDANSAT
jgi:hypothetical protein